MKEHHGKALSWSVTSGCIELALHRKPCNEIGSASLDEFERFVACLAETDTRLRVLIIYSQLRAGFSAGGDLRELYHRLQQTPSSQRISELRTFHERIHQVMNAIDSLPFTTIAAVQGVTFGGGFELALTCDLIIADRTARFCFPELRLGLIPGFGGIPRLKRDLGNGVVRDLLLTGRSFNACKAHQLGLVSQLVAEGEALRVARATAAHLCKFDSDTVARTKFFAKRIPRADLREEIEIVCELYTRPAIQAGLRKFVESHEVMPYLP